MTMKTITKILNKVLLLAACLGILLPALAQQGPVTVQVPVQERVQPLQAPTISPSQAPPTSAAAPSIPLNAAASSPAPVVGASGNYQLAAGDSIRITVFQSPDLTLETRISENGAITYPLVGSVEVGGLTIADAEKKIATALEEGRFVKQPQVNIALLQIVGNQVSVLGQVNRPGSYPLLTFGTRLTQMLATAGGLSPAGSPKVIVSGMRQGKPFNEQVDINAIYTEGKQENDIVLSGGDSIFVPRAPTFYIYGQVRTPGQYVIEPNMTMEQAIAAGGGLTLRGSKNRISVKRSDSKGSQMKSKPELSEMVRTGDVIFVDESLF